MSHWLRTYFGPDVLQTQPLGRVRVTAAVTHQNQSGFNLLQYICYLIDLGAEGKKIYQIPLEELLAFPGLSKLVNVETTPSVAYPYNHRTPYGILAMRPKLLGKLEQQQEDVAIFLRKHCADPNKREGYPLWAAVKAGNTNMVAHLSSAGANRALAKRCALSMGNTSFEEVVRESARKFPGMANLFPEWAAVPASPTVQQWAAVPASPAVLSRQLPTPPQMAAPAAPPPVPAATAAVPARWAVRAPLTQMAAAATPAAPAKAPPLQAARAAVPNLMAAVPSPMAAAANIKPPPPLVPNAGVTTAAVPPPTTAAPTPAAPQAAASSASAASPDPPFAYGELIRS